VNKYILLKNFVAKDDNILYSSRSDENSCRILPGSMRVPGKVKWRKNGEKKG
jgi:hypothetical protein